MSAVDLFYPPGGNDRGRGVMKSLHAGARHLKLDVEFMQEFKPRAGAMLVTYGMGGLDRYNLCMERMRHGPVVCWDVGYWDRKPSAPGRKFRVSINGLHCPERIMRGPRPSPARWEASGLEVKSLYDPSGPVVLVGNGPKSVAVGAGGWALKKSREIRKKLPKAHVVYRPKPSRPPEPGIFFDRICDSGTIDDLLNGASLVVCRHSNVAVDACRLGIPVVCDDGAAAAIYPRSINDRANQPTLETRVEFLHRIAYWQWSREECESGEAWRWLLDELR